MRRSPWVRCWEESSRRLPASRGIFLSLFSLCLLALGTGIFFVKEREEEVEEAPPAATDWSVLRKSGTLIGLCGFIFARSFGISYFVIFLPIFMHGTLHLNGPEIGTVLGAGTVVIALLLRPMGVYSDKVRRDRLIVAGGGFAAVLTFCLPLAENFLQLLGLSIGIGIAGALSMPACFALLVEEGGRQGMGLTMGVFNAAMNLGAVLAPLAGGAAFALFGQESLFYGAGVLGLAGTAFFFLAASAPCLYRADGFPRVSKTIACASGISVERMRREG